MKKLLCWLLGHCPFVVEMGTNIVDIEKGVKVLCTNKWTECSRCKKVLCDGIMLPQE